jgi:hypothetical protein
MTLLKEGAMATIPQPGKELDPAGAFRALRLIHMAMSGAVIVYALLAAIMLAGGAIPSDGFVGDFAGLHALRAALWIMAAGCFMGVRTIRSRLLAPEALRSRDTPLAQRILAWHVVMFALADAMAVLGLLLFILRGLTGDFLILGGAALATLLWLRPSEEDYHALVRDASRS